MKHGNAWKELPNYDFTGQANNYRIKPEPREIWVNEYPDGVMHAYASKDHAGPVAGVTKRYREIIE